MDDKLFSPKKNDFLKEIGEAGKFGIIEEEEKGNKKTKRKSKGDSNTLK